MATIFNAKTISKRGNLSKQNICETGKVPIALQMEQVEMIDVVLIERGCQLLSTIKREGDIKLSKGDRND
jgi:hypothetical protein